MILSWLVSLWMVFHLRIRFKRNTTRQQNQIINCCWLLIGTICSHLFAIRHLILLGHDVQARQILRSLHEYIGTLELILDDPGLAKEFLATTDPIKSNQFWYKNLRRGRSRQPFKKIMASIFAEESAQAEMLKWREDSDSILSMTVHPSQLACWMTLFAPGTADEGHFWPGFVGAKTETSISTISMAISRLWELLWEKKDFPFSYKIKNSALIRYNNKNGFHKHVRRGYPAVLSILVFSLTYASVSPELKETRSIDHLFPKKKKSVRKRKASSLPGSP